MSTDTTSRSRGRFAAMLLSAAVIASALVTGPVAAHAAEPVVGGYALSQARKIILDGTNVIRREAGLAPVAESAALNTVAQNWSARQAAATSMSHNPYYTSQYPSGWTTASENVAYGYAVAAVVAAWRNSPGHYKNIVQASANTLGIGVAMASNGSLYYTQNFATYPVGSVPPPPAPPAPPGPSIRTAGDVVVTDGSGGLFNYGKQGQIGVTGRVQIGSGWTGVKEVHVTDWNNDGVQDLVAQWKNGLMHAYPGLAAGGFGPRILIGNGGWGDVEVDIEKWKTGDGFPSVVMKDAAGSLWLYPNTTGGALTTRTGIGTGWGALRIQIVDFDKDGKQDVLATNPVGEILLYRTNGAGSFTNEARARVGSGWTGYTSVVLTGFGGSGTAGLVAKDTAGRLYYYPIQTNSFGARQLIGPAGWGGMTLSNN